MSSPTTSGPTQRLRTLPTAAAFAAAVISAAAVSTLLSAGVAAIAHSAGASHAFKALDIGTFSSLIVIGLLAAATAWLLVRRRSSDPRSLMSWLAPTVIILSLVPDVLVGVTQSLAGSSWGGVLALMSMHLLVAVVGVTSLQLFLPLPASAHRLVPAA